MSVLQKLSLGHLNHHQTINKCPMADAFAKKVRQAVREQNRGALASLFDPLNVDDELYMACAAEHVSHLKLSQLNCSLMMVF